MIFYYEAHNKWGEPTLGEIDALSMEEAAGKIRAVGLFARDIQTEPIGKGKYDKGVINASPVQAKVYDAEKDDIADLSSPTTDEHGESVDLPRPPGPVGSLRMTPIEDIRKPDLDKISKALGATRMGKVTRNAAGQIQQKGKNTGSIDVSDDDSIALKALRRLGENIKISEETVVTEEEEKVLEITPDEITPKEAQLSKWEGILIKDLEAISAIMSRMAKWDKVCEETPKGENLPLGTPEVGGRTWKIWREKLQCIGTQLFEEALSRAVRNYSR